MSWKKRRHRRMSHWRLYVGRVGSRLEISGQGYAKNTFSANNCKSGVDNKPYPKTSKLLKLLSWYQQCNDQHHQYNASIIINIVEHCHFTQNLLLECIWYLFIQYLNLFIHKRGNFWKVEISNTHFGISSVFQWTLNRLEHKSQRWVLVWTWA